MIATEESDQATYEEETKDYELEKTTKEQDVKYKSQEATDLDKVVAELFDKFVGEQTELEKEEMKAKHAYDMLMRDLKAQIEQAIQDPRARHRRPEEAGLQLKTGRVAHAGLRPK